MTSRLASTLVTAVVVSSALAEPGVAAAAEIRVWTTRAIATVLAEVGGEFERATGHKLIVTTDLPPAFLRRAQAGEPFDLLITGSAPLDEWIRDGRIVAKTRTEIARSGIGVEVRAGSPKPDISTVENFTCPAEREIDCVSESRKRYSSRRRAGAAGDQQGN